MLTARKDDSVKKLNDAITKTAAWLQELTVLKIEVENERRQSEQSRLVRIK